VLLLSKYKNLNLAYKVYNKKNKKNTILMFYGFDGSIDIMIDHFAPHIAIYHQVIVIDYPGHGYSHPVDHFNIEDFVDFAFKLLKNLNIKKIDLLGYSIGGIFTLEFYKKYKNMIKSLILLHTKHLFADNIYNKIKFKLLEILLHLNFNFTMTNIALPTLFDRRFTQDHIDASKKVVVSNCGKCVIDIYKKIIRRNCAKILPTINSKSLIIASKIDSLVSMKASRNLAQNIKNSSLVVISDYGHLSIVSGPEVIAGIIIDFLKRVK